jgi:hypothetical protein
MDDENLVSSLEEPKSNKRSREAYTKESLQECAPSSRSGFPQFCTRTGISYYKIGDLVSLTRSEIPNLMEDSPAMERIRNCNADLVFPVVNANYILENFGYEDISEEVLVERITAWREFHGQSEKRFQVAYSKDEQTTIYSLIFSWRNILTELNQRYNSKTDLNRLPFVPRKQVATSGELLAEALFNFRCDMNTCLWRSCFHFILL